MTMVKYIRQHYGRNFLDPVLEGFSTWRRRSADRRDLAQLDDYLLRDIGLSHGDRAREVSKPFWRS